MTESGAVLTIVRLRLPDTVVVALASSTLLPSISVLVVTLAVFTFVPLVVAVTLSVTCRLPPLGIAPTEQLTVIPACVQGPYAFDALLNWTPAGSGSFITTFSAVEGPLFVTVNV